MSTITEWLVSEKLATNGIAAGHIFEGLKLQGLDRAEQEARCILYRRWRPKTDKKNGLKSFEAFSLSIAGINPDDVPARQIDLFEEEDDSYGYAEQKNFD